MNDNEWSGTPALLCGIEPTHRDVYLGIPRTGPMTLPAGITLAAPRPLDYGAAMRERVRDAELYAQNVPPGPSLSDYQQFVAAVEATFENNRSDRGYWPSAMLCEIRTALLRVQGKL